LVVVAAVVFQAAQGQLFAAAAVAELDGIVVIFQIRQRLAAGLAFQQQAGLVVIIVATGNAARPGYGESDSGCPPPRTNAG